MMWVPFFCFSRCCCWCCQLHRATFSERLSGTRIWRMDADFRGFASDVYFCLNQDF